MPGGPRVYHHQRPRRKVPEKWLSRSAEGTLQADNMDSIRTSIDILPGESDAPPDLSATPRARLSQTLADNLLKARKQSEDTDATIGDDASEPSLAGFALCIEFEKTVEDQELWQSSFGNGLADETLEDRRRRDVSENRQRGKDVLLIWPDVAVSHDLLLRNAQMTLTYHASIAGFK
mgnify:CR=1 FL=1